jgi:hypothetical protein
VPTAENGDSFSYMTPINPSVEELERALKEKALSIQQRELEVKEEMLLVERKKLKVETFKARWGNITSAIPIVVALLTVIYGVYSLGETAKTQFGTKLVEVALQGRNPDEAINRAKFTASLFQEYVPKNFQTRLQNLNPNNYGTSGVVGLDETKRELIKMIAEHPAQSERIKKSWKALWPEYTWVDALP